MPIGVSAWPRMTSPRMGLSARLVVSAAMALMGRLHTSASAETALPEMDIVREGRPRAVTVVPEGAAAAERSAAEELQDYIKQVSSAELRIVVEDSASEAKSSAATRARRSSTTLISSGLTEDAQC